METGDGELTGGAETDKDNPLPPPSNPTDDGQQHEQEDPQKQAQIETKRAITEVNKAITEDNDGDSATNADAAIATTDISSSASPTTPVNTIGDDDDNRRDDDDCTSTPVRRLDPPQEAFVDENADDIQTTDNNNEEDQHPTTPVVTSLPDLNSLRPTTTPPSARTSTEEFLTRTPNSAASLRYNKAIGNENGTRPGLDDPYDNEERSFMAQHNSASAILSKSSKASTVKTLAALFGGPNVIANNTRAAANGDSMHNSLAAQHDYTLVGDSPYETTYDPRSPYYYNRVYGQLYITTISVMFRGKAFGPIGAIPFERRLLLPFVEVSLIEAYRTTSLKIFMDDGEQFVFKSFADREAVVKLLKRTRKRCLGSSNTNNGNTNQNRINTSVSLDSVDDTSHNENRGSNNNSSLPFLVTTTPVSNNNNSDVRKPSSSIPSSLRGTKTARTTPNPNSVVFEDTSSAAIATPNASSNELPEYAETPTTAKQLPIKLLRLSMSGDGNDYKKSNRNGNGANNTAGPRLLFDAKTSSAAILVSPPRTTISKRRQPKTPIVIANAGNQNCTKHTTKLRPQLHLHQPLKISQNNTSGAVAATIPSIPTVPSLNTPEPRANKTFIQFDDESSSESSNPTPTPMPGVPDVATTPTSDKNTAIAFTPRVDAPFTPVATHTTDNRNAGLEEVDKMNREAKKEEEDFRSKQLWLAARTQKKNEEWKIALEATKLPNCTLNDWFDLFFSDDADFSLARYQLEEIGDRDVQFDSWRRKTTEEMDGDDDDGIPELEREIKYIHPINGVGGVMGPSEAETFRRQSLKRYKWHGAVLKNVTTVGKGVPMGDCFRVEDKWIIEQHEHEHQQGYFTLTLSVSFRVVFVKRTMFRGIIQNNAMSETKKWFLGYSAMIERALSSEEHRERKQLQQTESVAPKSGASVKSTASEGIASVSPSSMDGSITTPESLNGKKIDFDAEDSASNTTVDGSPASKKPVGDSSVRTATAIVAHTNWSEAFSPISIARILLPILATAVLLALLVMILASLWFRVTWIGTTLSTVEGQLEDLKHQNTLLLREIERLSASVVAVATAEAAADAVC